MRLCFPISTRDLNIAEKYAKKLLGENEVEAVLQRLDRLTLEESKMTVTQTLEIVYGLVNNMEVVMEGTHDMLIFWSTRDGSWIRQAARHQQIISGRFLVRLADLRTSINF